jgi:hypothetical protein
MWNILQPKIIIHGLFTKLNICLFLFAVLTLNNSLCQGQSPQVYFFPDSIGTGSTRYAPDQYQSFIGNYQQALSTVGTDFKSEKHYLDSIAQKQKLQFFSLKKFVKSIPDSLKLILINEAHSYGIHRVFVKQMLPLLKSKGFDCLCMETYSWNDSSVSKNHFPTVNSGWYSNEASNAQMIREAIKLGYHLYPIETTRRVSIHRSPDGSIVKLDSITGDTLLVRYAKNFVPYYGKTYSNYREEDQAANIMRTFRQGCHKVLDLSGYGHVYKTDDMMAGILVDSFHMMPMTIDQTALMERKDTINGFSIKSVLSANKISILFTNNRPLSLLEGVDAHVVFPHTTFIHNRPSWLTKVDDRTLIPVKVGPGLKYPILIFAYYLDEYLISKEAVPVDVFACTSAYTTPYAALYRHRKYLIKIIDSNKKQYEYIKNVL